MRLRATLKIRNDAMLSARKKLGLSQPALADKAKVSLLRVISYEALDYTMPKDADKREDIALRIAKTLGISSDEVMPLEMSGLSAKADREQVSEVPTQALLEYADRVKQRLTCDASDIDAISNLDLVDRMLPSLKSRQREIVEMRFGLNGESPQTYDSVADKMGITKERVRQIEMGAIRKLQDIDLRTTGAHKLAWEDTKH